MLQGMFIQCGAIGLRTPNGVAKPGRARRSTLRTARRSPCAALAGTAGRSPASGVIRRIGSPVSEPAQKVISR